MTYSLPRSLFCRGSLAVLALASAAASQVVPFNFTLAEAPSATVYPTERVQYAYGAANWISQSITTPIVLRRIRVRANGGVVTPGGCIHNASVLASTLTVAQVATSASNLGPDCMQIFAGDVAVSATAGTTPNTWSVDVAVRPFVYNPIPGTSFVLDITVPSGSLQSATSISAGDAANPGTGGTCFRSTSATAPIGVPGPMGVIDIVYDLVPTSRARVEPFGFGCSDRPSGLHEFFDGFNPFDLANSSILFVPTFPGWVSVAGGAWVNPTGLALNLPLGDDEVSAPLALPWVFPLPPLLCPNGNCQNFPSLCTTIRVGSNGEIWFTDQTDTDYTPSRAEFVRGGPRLCAMWTDLNPSAGGTVTYEVVGPDVVVTWNGVPQFPTTVPNFVQAVLSPTGSVELRWGAIAASVPMLVGLTMGGRVGDQFDFDLSTLPSWAAAGVQPLELSCSPTPVLGGVVTFQVCAIPWDFVWPFGLLYLDVVAPKVPTDLSPFLPGCFWYLGPTPISCGFFLPTSCCELVCALPLPNNASLVGFDFYAQAAALNFLSWSWGATSNALHLKAGTF